MKVYSWKNLFITVFACGAGLALAFYLLSEENVLGIVLLIIWIIYFYQGMRASLTKKGYEKDLINGKKAEQILQNRFGKLAPVMPFGAALCLMTSAVLVRIFPMHLWIGMCFIFAAPVYQLWLGYYLRREMEKEG